MRDRPHFTEREILKLKDLASVVVPLKIMQDKIFNLYENVLLLEKRVKALENEKKGS